jgi:hypothetical protein
LTLDGGSCRTVIGIGAIHSAFSGEPIAGHGSVVQAITNVRYYARKPP